ncbi:MAG: 2,3-bisphosphoglycerate-dependent phosphoglycerate mutase, partial [Thermoleophilales bacterium]|nr:2,3-bisphosphoglycerate-dependent phosphoglycerate mutase [Thermoleophilales bacterium]
QIVGAAIGVQPRVDDRHAESRRGSGEGPALADIEATQPGTRAARKRSGAQFRFPGGESLAEHQQRVMAALEEVRAGPLPALVISHGGSIRCALSAHERHGLEGFWSIRVPNATLLELPADRAAAP